MGKANNDFYAAILEPISFSATLRLACPMPADEALASS